MPLAVATLDTELQAIAASPSEVEATQAALFAAGFNAYMLQSTVAGVPMVPALAIPAEAAMLAALTGLKVAGAAALQAGVVAYWGALNVPGVWGPTIAPTTPPPNLATLAAALVPVFVANTAGGLAPAAACAAIAAVWHPLMLGGTATLPGAPPVTTPIL